MLDPMTVGVGGFIGMLVMLALGVPVGISLGVSGVTGLVLTAGWHGAFVQLQNLPYHIASGYMFAVVPTFVLMGNLVTNSGMARELYNAADKWIGHLPGGLYLTTITASTAFGAVSGSTVVNSTVFTRIALPEMIRLGYSKRFASACIASVGTLDAMIPPSIAMVIYGIICEQSVGKLFMAGIVPGILSALAYFALVMVMCYLKPALAPVREEPAPWGERFRSLRGIWATLTLFLLVMAGIYFGIFPPSGAGAIGALATLMIVLGRRKLSAKGLWDALDDAVMVTAMLFVIIIGGMFFSRMLLLTGIVTGLVNVVQSLELGATNLIILFSVMYLILGCFMDAVSMMVVTLPFVFPIAKAANIEPIWFGILVTQLVEIGQITPPIGLNLFATVAAADGLVTMDDLIKGILPFVILSLAIWAVLVWIPQLSLWLPNTMMGK